MSNSMNKDEERGSPSQTPTPNPVSHQKSVSDTLEMPLVDILRNWQHYSSSMQNEIRAVVTHFFYQNTQADLDSNVIEPAKGTPSLDGIGPAPTPGNNTPFIPRARDILAFPLWVSLGSFRRYGPLTRIRIRQYVDHYMFSYIEDLTDLHEVQNLEEINERIRDLDERNEQLRDGGSRLDHLGRHFEDGGRLLEALDKELAEIRKRLNAVTIETWLLTDVYDGYGQDDGQDDGKDDGQNDGQDDGEERREDREDNSQEQGEERDEEHNEN